MENLGLDDTDRFGHQLSGTLGQGTGGLGLHDIAHQSGRAAEQVVGQNHVAPLGVVEFDIRTEHPDENIVKPTPLFQLLVFGTDMFFVVGPGSHQLVAVALPATGIGKNGGPLGDVRETHLLCPIVDRGIGLFRGRFASGRTDVDQPNRLGGRDRLNDGGIAVIEHRDGHPAVVFVDPAQIVGEILPENLALVTEQIGLLGELRPQLVDGAQNGEREVVVLHDLGQLLGPPLGGDQLGQTGHFGSVSFLGAQAFLFGLVHDGGAAGFLIA